MPTEKKGTQFKKNGGVGLDFSTVFRFLLLAFLMAVTWHIIFAPRRSGQPFFDFRICVTVWCLENSNPRLLQAWARRGLNAMGWDNVCAVRPSVEAMAFDGVASVEAWIS